MLGTAVGIALSTLVVLELVLALLGISPITFMFNRSSSEPSPYMTCDVSGCHMVYQAVFDDCEAAELSGRVCTVNRQGYPGPADFDASEAEFSTARFLMLGDSFTFGMSADIGKSYVETIQANFPAATIWNAAIPGTGPVQAVASFNSFAPMLKPHLTILGFVTNDFRDNLLPLAGRRYYTDEDGKTVAEAITDLGRLRDIQETDTRLTGDAYAGPLQILLNRSVSLIGRSRLGSLLLRLMYTLDEVAFVELSADDTEITRGYLAALRDAATELDGSVLIMLISSFDGTAAHGKLHKIAIQMFEDLRIPYFDPTDLLDPDTDFAPPPDGHWNNLGHQKVAAYLSECIDVFIVNGDLADCVHVTMP